MARLDTGWHAHPKILALGLPAMGLHAWSISYCDHALSDGFIPAGAWPALPGVKAAVFALLRVGLWSAVDGGFQLHDYTDYNRTKAQVQAQREEDRVRKMSGRTNGRNHTGLAAESDGNPRAPGPGPGIKPAAAAAGTPEGGLGGTVPSSMRSLSALLSANLDHAPPHVVDRRDQQRQQQRQFENCSESPPG